MQSTANPDPRPDPDQWPDAACRHHPTATFYPDDDRNSGPAKAICAICPHRAPCGEHALATRERYGVWGGLSEQDRHAILRERGRGTGTPRNCSCANPPCPNPVTSTAHNARFCSPKCRAAATERRRPSR